MNIAFDLDGVLYPWHEAVYDHLRSNGKINNLTYTEFWKNWTQNISENELRYLQTIPMLYSCHLPSGKMLKMLNDLDKKGHTLYYITSRPDCVTLTTQMYLERYKFPQSNNFIVSNDKTHEIRVLEIDIIIEDRAESLEKFSSLCRTIGISQPWNRDRRDYLESLGVVFIPDVIHLPEIL